MKIGISLLIILTSIFFTNARADDSGTVFVEKCGSCHKNSKKVRKFTPARYTSAQWRRFFDKNKHQRKKDIGDLITYEERDQIRMYLISHSKDSAEPDVIGFSRDNYIWDIGTMIPKNIAWAKLYREIILPVCNMIGDGNITINLHWGDLVGDDTNVIQKMESGELDGGGLSGYGTYLLCPEMSVLSLPFLFNTNGELDYVKKKMTPVFDKYMKKRGYKLLLLTDQDFDQVYSRKYEMSLLSHFSKSSFGSWFGTIEQKLLYTLKAKVLLPSKDRNIYSLIHDQSKVDAFIGPAIFTLYTGAYTEIKYVNRFKIRYSPGSAVIKMDAWNEISPLYKKRFEGEFKEYIDREYSEAVRRDNKRAFNALIKYGIKEVKMDPKEFDKMKILIKPLWFEMADSLYPKEVLLELLNHLEVYRNQVISNNIK